MLQERIANKKKSLACISATILYLLACLGLRSYHNFRLLKIKETHVRTSFRRKLIGEDEHGDYDYESIYKSNGNHTSYEDRRIFNYSSFNAYMSPDVLRNGCKLTSILMEPRLSDLDFKEAAWYTLESLATFAPYSCLVIQTSSCALLPQSEPMSRQIEEVAKRIYSFALPRFRRMMEQGLVRITILDHEKYNLPSCTNFHSPTNAWMNFHYWNDELINKVDSDIILMIQTDSVICRYFDYNLWSDLSFIGAPWAPTYVKILFIF
jgi:hypothetical protein